MFCWSFFLLFFTFVYDLPFSFFFRLYVQGWTKVGLQLFIWRIINNNIRVNAVSCTHDCKPTFAHPVYILLKSRLSSQSSCSFIEKLRPWPGASSFTPRCCGLILCQGSSLGFGFGPWSGCVQKATSRCFCITYMSLSSSLSKNQ